MFLNQRLLTIVFARIFFVNPNVTKELSKPAHHRTHFHFILISPPIFFTHHVIKSLLSWYLCICSITITTFPSFILLRLDLINRWNLSPGECIISASDAISRRKKADSYTTVCQRVHGSTIFPDVKHLRKRVEHLFAATVKSPPTGSQG